MNPDFTDPTSTTVNSLHHKAANYAIAAIVGSFVLQFVLYRVSRHFSPETGRLMQLIPTLAILSAIPAGIIALCGIPLHGMKKLLWKGSVGVVVPLALFWLSIQMITLLREISKEQVQQDVTAKVFLVPWGIMTNHAMTPAEVRAQAGMQAILTNQEAISEVIGFVSQNQMTKNPDYSVNDVRLVIDLVEANGDVTTFIASRLAMSNAQTPELNVQIDESFRSEFERWLIQKANQHSRPQP